MSNEVKEIETETGSVPTETRRLQKTTYRPVTDVYRNEERVRILMDVPGAQETDIDVSVHDGQLHVQAEVERSDGDIRVYERSFRLDRRMNTSDMEATLQRGVLTLGIPFHEEAKPKKISVRSA